MIRERAWLAWVRSQAESASRPKALALGIGDDAALLRPRRGHEVALTTDLMVEDVHFLRDRDPAAAVGRRLATRALSDLAAMGAEPVALFVSTAFPPDLPAAWGRAFYRGLLAAAAAASAALAGGDVASAPSGKIVLDVAGAGQVPAGAALRRDGARPGDRIFVSCPAAELGEAARGRELVHSGTRSRTAADRRARARHLRPRARWELGVALRRRASAAMDISDGLALDLDRLCLASRVGAELSVPLTERALAGGEDYELLFTLPPRRRVPPGFRAAEIGVITTPDRDRRPRPTGWEHFDGRGPQRGDRYRL